MDIMILTERDAGDGTAVAGVAVAVIVASRVAVSGRVAVASSIAITIAVSVSVSVTTANLETSQLECSGFP